MVKEKFDCIFCGLPLTDDNYSDEHVIPNAIGGHLVTRNATCSNCNSKSGYTIDNCLVNNFSLLANALDVPRDRGQHPDAYIYDEKTDRKLILSPGKNVALAPNIRVDKEEGRISFNYYAPTRKEAEKYLKKNMPKDFKGAVDLVGKKIEGERYSFSLLNVTYNNEEFLKGIVKIALCYTRHLGLPINVSSIARSFLRGEGTKLIPVGTVRSNVINLRDPSPYPLYHGIFLFKYPEKSKLIVYIMLFQAFEFIVLVDEDCEIDDVCKGYLWNIVSACSESHKVDLVADLDEITTWFGEQEIRSEHFSKKAASLVFWLNHRDDLWINRAISIATRHFIKRIDMGIERKVAEEEAKKLAQKAILNYGLSIQELNISQKSR